MAYILKIGDTATATFASDKADEALILYKATVLGYEMISDYSVNVTLQKTNGTSGYPLLERFPAGKLTISRDEIMVLLDTAFSAGANNNRNQLDSLKETYNEE
jgi:hypothetical protein